MENFVIHELKSCDYFMRYRANHFFAKYGFIEFNNPQNISNAVAAIYSCTCEKEGPKGNEKTIPLPVRVQAAIALNQMVEQEEAIAILKPGLKQVLSNYINIMSVIDNDDVVDSLQEFVLTFGDQITYYAAELVRHLAGAYFKLVKYNQQTGHCILHIAEGEERQNDDAVQFESVRAIQKLLLNRRPVFRTPALELAYRHAIRTGSTPVLFDTLPRSNQIFRINNLP